MKRLLALLLPLVLVASPALASGPATVAATAGSGTPFKTIQDVSGNNGAIIAIGDGSALANVAAVKAATTAAGTNDPSLVVQLSPNGIGGTSGTPLFASITNAVSVSLPTSPALASGSGVIIYQGGALSTTNGIYSNLLQGNAVLSGTNGVYSNILQGNVVLSATNGIYANLLQGNAVLSSSNPIFDEITDGTHVNTIKAASTASVAGDTSLVVQLSPNQAQLTTPLNFHDAGIVEVAPTSAANTTGNPFFVTGTGTAGTAATNPITVQGIASMTPLLANPGTASNWGIGATGSSVPANDLYTGINIGGTNRGLTGVNPSGAIYAAQTDVTSVNGVTVLTGTGATGTGAQRVTVATDTATIAGSAPGTAGTASSNVISVQGIASMTPVNTEPQATLSAGNSGYAYQVSSTPTVTASAYTANQCLGGFNSITVAANNAQSGLVTNFQVWSKTGLTPTITVYLFEANPSSSTCTDHGTFTLNAADISKIIGAPIGVTLVAPGGATPSVGEVTFNPPRPFLAGGSGSSVKTIYYAMTTSAITPASTSEFVTKTGVVMN